VPSAARGPCAGNASVDSPPPAEQANEVIREKCGQHICKDWKTCCDGHVVCMKGSRWTWSPEGRRRGRPEVKWGKEVEGVMLQRNLISGNAAKPAAMASENR
jgi:hypothetical protein